MKKEAPTNSKDLPYFLLALAAFKDKIYHNLNILDWRSVGITLNKKNVFGTDLMFKDKTYIIYTPAASTYHNWSILVGLIGPAAYLTIGRQSYLLQKINPRSGRRNHLDHPPPHKFPKRPQIKDQALAYKQLWISSLLSITKIKF